MKKITLLFLTAMAFVPWTLFAQNIHSKIALGVPIANFSAPVDSFCGKRAILSFTDLSSNGPTGWKWYFPGGTPDTSTYKNPTNIIYNGYGCYSVKLVVKNVSGSDSLTKTNYICLDSMPLLMSSGPDTICKGDSITFTVSGAGSYSWFNGNTNSSVTISPPASITYTVELRNKACIIDTAITITVKVCTGTASISDPVDILISPNPVSTFLLVTIQKPLWNSSILSVTDIAGREVIIQKINSAEKQLRVDVSSLTPAMYFIKLQTNQGIVTKEFSKK